MGQFSWITQDDHTSIRNNVSDLRARAFMHDNKGNVWEEPEYDGYGNFGGKDFFQLVAEMNNCEGLTGNADKDRDKGIELVYSKKPYISPNLTRKKEWKWINRAPQDCPNQGWADLKYANMIQIKTVQQLKEACTDEMRDFFIQLNASVRSSKAIQFHSDEEIFEIYNFIDDSKQKLTEKELFTESHIGKAITKGALYLI